MNNIQNFFGFSREPFPTDLPVKELYPLPGLKVLLERFDYAVATHPHHDHIGGYIYIINKVPIKQFLMINVPHSTRTYARFIESIQDKKIPVEYLEEGDEFLFGNDISIDVLNPEKGTGPHNVPEEMPAEIMNDYSLVMKLTYGEKSFLFTGDIYIPREQKLIESKKDMLDSDFIKAPHHGESTSSSSPFIQAVSPEHTVMTINILQSLGVYKLYRKYGSVVHITGIDGNILLKCDGKEIEIVTEKDRDSTFLK